MSMGYNVTYVLSITTENNEFGFVLWYEADPSEFEENMFPYIVIYNYLFNDLCLIRYKTLNNAYLFLIVL